MKTTPSAGTYTVAKASCPECGHLLARVRFEEREFHGKSWWRLEDVASAGPGAGVETVGRFRSGTRRSDGDSQFRRLSDRRPRAFGWEVVPPGPHYPIKYWWECRKDGYRKVLRADSAALAQKIQDASRSGRLDLL